MALDKDGFQGKEALLHDRDSTTLRLTSVELESGGDEATGAPILLGELEIGYVTQALFSPYRSRKTVGLAKVHKDRNQPGARIQARVGDEMVAGQIVRHPVYEPDRKRAKES